MWDHLKFAYEAPNSTTQSQTKACIAKCNQNEEQSMTEVMDTTFFLTLPII